MGGNIKFLGIDVGTTGTRALIMDEFGRLVASGTAEHIPFASPRLGWAEQDPRDWWRASVVAVRQALTGLHLEMTRLPASGFPDRCTVQSCSMLRAKSFTCAHLARDQRTETASPGTV